MNQEELKKILPHRNSMLLVQEAEVKTGEDGIKESHGKYTVSGNEFFLDGHFPGNPVVPGVILCEMLAQSACVLFEDQMQEGMIPMFTGIKEVKFKNPVRPGDTYETTCQIVRQKPPFYFAKGTGKVDGKLCVKAEFSFALVKEG